MKKFNFYTSRAGYALSNGLWRYALAVLVIMSVSTTAFSQKTPPDPGQGATVAGFEVDANFLSGNIPTWWTSSNYMNLTTLGDDWSKGLISGSAVLKQIKVPNLSTADPNDSMFISTPGTSADLRAIWQVDGNWGNNSTVAEKFSFAGNSNKNSDFIAPGQSPYSIQAGGSGPQKNDITNTYLHSREDTSGDTWLFFGAETRATSGNSYLDFEYNQNGVSVVGNQLVGKANDPANNIINGRTVNDFMLVINYTGGGNRPVVGIRKWLTSGTWSEELPVSNLGAFVTTNIQEIAPVAPNMAFAGDGAYANVVMALQFVEGGVNISDVPGLEELNLCSPNATVTVKTRSSSSFTAELKDFDILNFSLLPGASLSIAEDTVSVCPTDSAVFNATASGSGALGSNIVWYHVVSGDSTLLNDGDREGRVDISVDGLTSILKIFDVEAGDAASGSGSYYLAVLTGADCGMPSDTAKLLIQTLNKPIVVLTEPTICGPKTGTLKVCNPLAGANYYLVQIDSTASPIDSVYSQQVLDYDLDSLVFTGLLPGYGFNLRVEKGGCEEIATCDDVVTACTAGIQSSTSKIEGISTSSISVQSIKNDESIANARDESLTAYPVPFSNKATIEFRLEDPVKYEVNLYDMKGNLIKQLKSGRAKAGELQQIEVDGQNLPEGIYLVRMASGKGVQTVKLLKKE